jgi:DNA-binding MarR family transcriptional regulator
MYAENVQEDEVDKLIAAIPDPLTPDERVTIEVYKRLSILSRLFHDATNAVLAPLALTYAEFEVLAALRRAGEPYRHRPNELSRDLVITSGGMSNVLHRLESAGLVRRVAVPDDRRGKQVELTDEGLRMAREAVQRASEAHGAVLAPVPSEMASSAAGTLRELLLAIRSR